MKQLVIYSLIIIFTLTSCQKCKNDKNAPKYTISGRMMQNCTTPYANKTVSLYQEVATTGNSGGTLVTGSTDSDGNFTLEYKPENSWNINLRNSNDEIVTKIPIEQTINLGMVTINPICKINYKIKVINTYTINDTIRLSDIANPTNINGIRIPGPFHDTILGTFIVPTLSLNKYPNHNSSNVITSYAIYNSGYTGILKYFNVNAKICNNNLPDTLTVYLE
jgi:hypothetical protein